MDMPPTHECRTVTGMQDGCLLFCGADASDAVGGHEFDGLRFCAKHWTPAPGSAQR